MPPTTKRAKTKKLPYAADAVESAAATRGVGSANKENPDAFPIFRTSRNTLALALALALAHASADLESNCR